MNYSSAIFETPDMTSMKEAQHAKVRRALRMAQRQAGRPRTGNRLRLGRAGREGDHRI